MDEKGVQLRLLGAFEARAGGRVIIDSAWPNRRAATLLKLLAMNGGSLHRDQIYEAIWPQLEPDAAAGNLRRCLHQLRTALDGDASPPVLSLEPERVVLDSGVEVDVDVFLRLAQEARAARTDAASYDRALAAYTGDLLPGDLYEDYCEPLRSELREQRNRLLLEAALLHESEGRNQEAEEYLRRLIAIDAANEGAHCALMRVYAASGQRDRALRQYQRCVEALSQELDAKPSEQTEALYRQIKGTDQTAATPADAPPSVPLPPAEGRLGARARVRGADRVMDAPPIQYCKTSDGVSLAYWTMGNGGTPLVLQPPKVFGHIALEWEDPRLQDWYLHLAERRLIVRYDPRGNGLSERNVADYSLEALVRDVQSVVDRLSLRRFALMSFGGVAPVVMAYAAEFPDRVTRLLLQSPVARQRDIFEQPAMKEVLPLLDKDWRLFTETAAQALVGWEGGRASHEWAGFIRSAVTEDAVRGMIDADASASVPRIQAPTLILHPKILPLERTQQLASDIADARLLQVDNKRWGDLKGLYVRAVDEFLADGDEDTAQPAEPPSGTAIILFLDIAGSTELTTRLGDAAYREKERDLDGALRQAVREVGGSPVEGKVLGDGVMATFASAKDAIGAALGCAERGRHVGLPLHAGIHAGDVTREGNNVHGGAVQVAARIADASAPGEVLVSQTVRDLARTSAGVSFEDRGEHELKGVSEPVRLWGVLWSTEGE